MRAYIRSCMLNKTKVEKEQETNVICARLSGQQRQIDRHMFIHVTNDNTLLPFRSILPSFLYQPPNLSIFVTYYCTTLLKLLHQIESSICV